MDRAPLTDILATLCMPCHSMPGRRASLSVGSLRRQWASAAGAAISSIDVRHDGAHVLWTPGRRE